MNKYEAALHQSRLTLFVVELSRRKNETNNKMKAQNKAVGSNCNLNNLFSENQIISLAVVNATS